MQQNQNKQFYVYFHKRPDGSVFYIGKGLKTRAYEFAKSRRTEWHNNIVNKYGRENIIVDLIPCLYEKEAFELEKLHIFLAKQNGYDLVNLTDGGEGASGHKLTEKQKLALDKGRQKGKRGTKGPRPHLEKWINSDKGREHLKRLSAFGSYNLHKERTVCCEQCSSNFITRSAKARFCGRRCEQINRRARSKAN